MNEVLPSVKIEGEAPEKISGVISVLNVKPNDRLIWHVEVGNMPPPKIQERLKDLAAMMKTFLPEGVQCFYVPMKNGVPTAELTVLRYEQSLGFGEK